MTKIKNFWLDFSASIATYLLMIWRVGYHFGNGDQEEVLGQILYKTGIEGLGKDFLVSSVGISWTVRSPFVNLMSLFGQQNTESAFLIFHVIVYLLLFYFIIRLCRIFANSHFALVAPAIAVVLFYAKSPGANDLFSAHLIAESFSITSALMAVFFWLDAKRYLAGILLLISVLFHPLNGIQVFLLILATEFFADRAGFKNSMRIWFLPFLLSVAYILWLQFQTSLGAVSSSFYYDLLVRFRNPHHYLPSQFPISTYLIVVGMLVVVWFAFRGKERFPLFWIGLTLCGMAFYTIGVELFDSATIAKTQWFKTSIWIRVWFALALVNLVERVKLPKVKEYVLLAVGALSSVALVALIIKGNSGTWRVVKDKNLEEISVKCAEELPEGSLFIQPIGVTGFQYYSRQPLYVSFKSVLHYPKFFADWYGRLLPVYGELDIQKSGFDQFGEADKEYQKHEDLILTYLKNEGVEYMLAIAEIENPRLELEFSNESYWVYRIQ